MLTGVPEWAMVLGMFLNGESSILHSKTLDLLHECFFEGVNRFPANPGNDSRRRSIADSALPFTSIE